MQLEPSADVDILLRKSTVNGYGRSVIEICDIQRQVEMASEGLQQEAPWPGVLFTTDFRQKVHDMIMQRSARLVPPCSLYELVLLLLLVLLPCVTDLTSKGIGCWGWRDRL
jgi:hypothetical protein